jgi:Flp pilus assembly protein TadG
MPGRLSSSRGAAVVELAISLPVLLLMMFGAADLARVYYTALGLTAAARAGAQYGALTPANTSNTATMQSRALAASPQLGAYTAVASRACQCANQTATTFTTQSCTSACSSSSSHLVVYVTVTASKTFSTRMPIPGVPTTFNISRSVSMRAQ